MLSPDVCSINDGPGLPIADSSIPIVKQTEKAPLISRRRFFWNRLSRSCDLGGSSSSSYYEFGNNSRNGRTLGTFAGVFSPVALSMFSALLFLRVGYIVGNAGLIITVVQFIIAYAILLFTVASICAVSSNGAVEGGGAYFMISRTLGPEFGGAIGTLFFIANIVSSALYITGFTEGLVENAGPSGLLIKGLLPDGGWWRFLYSSVLNVLNLLVCLIGAGMFAKMSVIILGVVCTCLASVLISFFAEGFKSIPIPEANKLVQNDTYHVQGNYTGLSYDTLKENLHSHYGQDYSSGGEAVYFATVFAVLFSGVTGIMAGANMSGELKNPARNISRGTLSAVGFTFIVYIIISILTAASCTQFLLQNNFVFMMPINVWQPFVSIGILAATSSASLSNLIGSSRVLEALAKDNVFGPLLHFVTRGIWQGNPIAAVLFSWFLVELIMLMGSLNAIAQLNSILFLLSYLATNLACLVLELASAPNFRPSFKYFSWYTAMFGLIGTLIMMFIINSITASSCIIGCLILVITLHYFSPSRDARWGSISQALIFHQVRKYLLLLDSRKDHVKFWRPQMLLLVNNPRTACPLIQFVNDLKKSGLYVLGHVCVGDFNEKDHDSTLHEYVHWLTLVDHLKVKAFIELTVSKTVREGMHHMIRMSGLGAMKPNTIVLGFYDEIPPYDFFERQESQYRTTTFSDKLTYEGIPLFELRSDCDGKTLSGHEFVAMMADVLKMKKNLCVCRHFYSLDKMLISKSSVVKYIDVWPINFMNPSELDQFDTTSLFILQLACIINMVPGWKKLQLRVFLCEVSEPVSNIETSIGSSDASINIQKGEQRLRELLQMLRIAASIHPLTGYADLYTGWRQCLAADSNTNADMSSSTYSLLHRANSIYLHSVNDLICQNSQETAATFIYLPPPPQPPDNEVLNSQYLELLTQLTTNLPPTVLVHGVHAVTSTAF